MRHVSTPVNISNHHVRLFVASPARDPLFDGLAPRFLLWELVDRRRALASMEREYETLSRKWPDPDASTSDLLRATRRLDALDGKIAIERRLIAAIRAELKAAAS